MDFISRAELFGIGRQYVLSRATKVNPAQVDTAGSDVNLMVGGGSVVAYAIVLQLIQAFNALTLDGAKGDDLDRYALSNINLMEKVGSTDQVKIAVELGRLAIHDMSEGGWKGQRRDIIQKDNDPDHVTSPISQAMPKADMGDWHHLVDFVAWARQAASR